MSNRIIIIKSCEECPRSGAAFLMRRRACLGVFTKDGERICPEEGTPDWCPLPEAPERLAGITLDPDLGINEISYMMGWNECADSIRGEEETE